MNIPLALDTPFPILADWIEDQDREDVAEQVRRFHVRRWNGWHIIGVAWGPTETGATGWGALLRWGTPTWIMEGTEEGALQAARNWIERAMEEGP